MTKIKTDFTLTPEKSLPNNFVNLCKSVKAKRARTVVDHILHHGMITNEDLSELYCYDHPPRAIRDVREQGIPLITHRIISPKSNRYIGAYTFDLLSNVKSGRLGGRKIFSKKFKQELVKEYGAKDAFSGETLDERYLQIDHRIPYEIAGDSDVRQTTDFMLLDASSQRAKSWSCEHCENMLGKQDITLCKTCFWASPENYEHVALKKVRRTEIIWNEAELNQWEILSQNSIEEKISLSEYIKKILKIIVKL